MVCVKDITSAKNMVIEKMFHNRSIYIIENYTEAYKKITMFKINYVSLVDPRLVLGARYQLEEIEETSDYL